MKEVKELSAILARAFHLPVTWDTPGIIAGRRAFVFGIQRLDRRYGILNQAGVLGQGFTVCVAEIGQQGKEQPGFRVAKIMQFELVSERIDFLAAGDQRGDNNQSLERVGDFVLEVKLRQNAWSYHQGDQPVDQAGGNGQHRDQQC